MKNSTPHEIFVGRQPIFNNKMKLFGYELLFRDADINAAKIVDGDAATSKVIIDGFELAQRGTDKNLLFFINFPYNMLVSGAADILPKDKVVIEVLEDVIIDKKVLKACIDLKKKGYLIALDDYIGQITNEKLFKIIDIVKIDILNMELTDIEKLIFKIKKINSSLNILAEKVEDRNTFDSLKKMGADLFQGFFFQKPEIIKGKSIPNTTITRLRLLAFFSKKQNNDLEELESIIKTDVTLSYKLLNYINSPSIGLPHKIKYIRQAINLLGYHKIIRWCRVFLMSMLNPTDRGKEIIRQSTVRGYFLMLLKKIINTTCTEDELFILGLFSMLDALLDEPMENILKLMPLDDIIKDTLIGKETPLSPYLNMIKMQEMGRWKELSGLIDHLKIPMDLICSAYVEALTGTDKLFRES